MNQVDFIGGGGQPVAPRVATQGNTRPSIAEEKAVLALQLGELVRRRVPPKVCNGSVQTTRDYMACLEQCKKLLKKGNASVQELNSAISKLSKFWG